MTIGNRFLSLCYRKYAEKNRTIRGVFLPHFLAGSWKVSNAIIIEGEAIVIPSGTSGLTFQARNLLLPLSLRDYTILKAPQSLSQNTLVLEAGLSVRHIGHL